MGARRQGKKINGPWTRAESRRAVMAQAGWRLEAAVIQVPDPTKIRLNPLKSQALFWSNLLPPRGD